VDVASLRALQDTARELATSLGLVHEPLTDPELEALGTSYERQFLAQNVEREIVAIHLRHQVEALVGAMVAKKQMDAPIDGEQPASGKIGVSFIRAGFLGVGNDWDITIATANTVTPWIHSGTALLAGTAGRPIRIGTNLVVVVYGLGTLVPSPKIESFRFTIDGKPKPVLFVGQHWRTTNLRVKELDFAYLFKKGTTVLAEFFPTATGAEAPYLIGVAFVKEPQLRELSPSALVTTAADMVFTT